MLKIISMISIMVLATSCATSSKSTMLGMGIGTVVGGGIGAAAGSSQKKAGKGAAIGAAVGAAIGGLAGYSKFNEDKNKKSIVFKNYKTKGKDFNPSMTMPKVRRMWIPDRVEGNKLIRGHFVYIMEESSRWRLDDFRE